jgi:hypothetical protein
MSRSQSRKRNKIVRAAFTPDEHAELIEKATAVDMSAAGYLRSCGLERETPGTKRRPAIESEKLERAIAELRRVGNNLNQLARASNMLLPPDAAQLGRALEEYFETLNLLRDARRA